MRENPELQAAIDSVLEVANANEGCEVSPELRDALNRLSMYSPEHLDEILSAVGEALPTLNSPSGAGVLSVWLGAMVENGAKAEITAWPVLSTLLKWSRCLETPTEEAVPPPEHDQETLSGMSNIARSVVVHLSRSASLRLSISQQSEVFDELERTEHLSVGAMWVVALLRQRSGELVVLHVAQKKGVRVAFENVGNCFHLFTLLQGALKRIMPGSRVVSRNILALAQGEENGEGFDFAWWHYGQGNVPKAELNGMVFGEESPDTIARIEGEQVLLLWPPILQNRSWDAGFFGPILHASLPRVHVVSELSPEQINRWWELLKLPEPRKSKWKFW